MKAYLTAFLMAWGNFLLLPCPRHKWDEQSKNLMLGWLPLIGFVVGFLWCALIMLAGRLLGLPLMLTALISTFYIYAICGFIHLDGFMDVADAVLSRRSQEERIRILKDARVGAFAVISLFFLLLTFFVLQFLFLEERVWTGNLLALTIIPVASRMAASLAVLCFEPMKTSGYSLAHRQDRGRSMILCLGSGQALILAVAILSSIMGNIHDGPEVMVAGYVTAAATLFCCLGARKNLGAMNGDIAGFSICAGEAIGMCALVLLTI